MKAAFNPSSVHVLVGVQNRSFDDAMRRGELEEAANILNGPIRTYAAVFMTEDDLQSWDAKPNYRLGDDRQETVVARDMENRRIELLRVLRKQVGVLATAPDEYGDSSGLDEEMPDVIAG